jgi:hypothetical protein
VDAARREFEEEQDVEALEEEGVDGEEVALEDLAACARRNSAQLGSCRLGDGSIPASLRIVQTGSVRFSV